MTLEEAKALARTVLENKSRSYVDAARRLSEFVMALPDTEAPHALTCDMGVDCACRPSEGGEG